MKYLFNKPIEEMSLSEFTIIISDKPLKDKSKILEFMRSYPLCAFTSEPGYDRITGEIICEADNGRSDGTFQWYESDIYNFEKYNLMLNDDFIEHVLNQTK